MVISDSRPADKRFVTAILPWVVGAGGLLLYLATLNPWVSMSNIGVVARVSGWMWQPELFRPLTALVLCPFGALPRAWVPLALDLFNAVCAAWVLVLLARSVALLPHDLPPEEPPGKSRRASLLDTPGAWMPPVLAAIVCGLQSSFWEQATSMTGEMLDLLVLAWVVRCLLEYRIDQREAWLSRSALLFGAGMADNWMLIGFLPVYLAAVLRTTGLSGFLRLRFLRRMLSWGLAGMSLYLLLPAVHTLHPHADMSFWAALKINLKSQTVLLAALRHPAFRMVGGTCLLSLLVLSIRWKSHTLQLADDGRLGLYLTKLAVHGTHGILFLASLWLALDPTFSPRHLIVGTPFVTSYYYLSALAAGYCAGYFLLMGSMAAHTGFRPSLRTVRGRGFVAPRSPSALAADVVIAPSGQASHPRRGLVPKLAAAAIALLVGALPLALLWRNLGQIRRTNGPALHELARELYADLPAGKSVVLSHDPMLLLLLRAELATHGSSKEVLPLDSLSLPSCSYQTYLARQFKSIWPLPPPTNRFEVMNPAQVRQLISGIAEWRRLYYINPSYDFLFEDFTSLPAGWVSALEDRRMSPLVPPPLTEGQMAANEQLWQQRWAEHLQALAQPVEEQPRTRPHGAGSVAKLLRFDVEPNPTMIAVRLQYAEMLDTWAVELQRRNRWPEAAVWFRRALSLNPGNLAAAVSLEFNQRWQRGEKQGLSEEWLQEHFGAQFARYRRWSVVLGNNGRFDEPTMLFDLARTLIKSGDPLQAGREFARCAELNPDWLQPRLWLAVSYLNAGEFDRALAQVQTLQDSFPPQDPEGQAELVFCRTMALNHLGRSAEAAFCLQSFIRHHRDQTEVLSLAASLYAENDRPEECVSVLDPLLLREPNVPERLVQKGFAELELSRYEEAVTSLTQAQALTPYGSPLHQALASLLAGNLDAITIHSRELMNLAGDTPGLLVGLGEIAWHNRDTNTTITVYQQCLAAAAPGTPSYALALQRLQQFPSAVPDQNRASAKKGL
jgi:tetratricopeptide (TPR) repeat protein